MKKILQYILRIMARLLIWRYKPIVIGITGSIGKTTTKDAIADVLSIKYRVRKSKKNYNNEIGLPLAIFGEQSPGKSFIGWMCVGFSWVRQIIFDAHHPEVLVLEMGVDRPGDMEYLLSIVQPAIGVITGVFSSHLEYFGNIRSIAREKGKLIHMLSKNGVAVLNADNSYTVSMLKKTKARTITYGFDKKSNMRGFNEVLEKSADNIEGIRFKIEFEGKVLPVRLKNIIAYHHVYAVLAAFSVASVLKINMVEAVQKMESFTLPKGRFQFISGVNGTRIIDDTYNASPASTVAALEAFEQFSGKKYLVLGDMLELGSEEETGHRSLAEIIIRMKADGVFLVGNRMFFLASELDKKKYPKAHVHLFQDPEQAAKLLLPRLRLGDLILIKGSQGMRMEKAVKILMRDPLIAEKVLCRQDVKWRSIPFALP